MNTTTRILAALIATASGAANASPFVLERLIDTQTAVPSDISQTFIRIDEPPRVSDGRLFLSMQHNPDLFIEGLYTVASGELPVEVALEGAAMPDGIGTIERFATLGFDISGANLVYTVRRNTVDEDAVFLRRNDVDELILEVGLTPLPDSPLDTFSATGSSDTFSLVGEEFVFEGFGSAGQNGIYGYMDGALTTITQTGDASPNGSTFASALDEPSFDGVNIAFEARTNDGSVQGAFAHYDGGLRTVATTDMVAPGSAATFSFIDNPQIDAGTVVFGASVSDGSAGIYRSDLSTTPATTEAIVRLGDSVPGHPDEQFIDLGDEGVSLSGRLIVFTARFTAPGGFGIDPEERGLFAWYDGTLYNIADTTQTLSNRTASFFDFEGEGIDGQQFAFQANFTDGTGAAYLVTLQPDSDGDGIADASDNCTNVANADQRDSNGDGYGNACDADLNNDGIVNVLDLGQLRTVFFTNDADADFNGDGVVNVIDLGTIRARFFAPPGPSGIAD